MCFTDKFELNSAMFYIILYSELSLIPMQFDCCYNILEYRHVDDFISDSFWLLYHIKRIDSMLPCICRLKCVNPLTPRSDSRVTSPSNIHALSSKLIRLEFFSR